MKSQFTYSYMPFPAKNTGGVYGLKKNPRISQSYRPSKMAISVVMGFLALSTKITPVLKICPWSFRG